MARLLLFSVVGLALSGCVSDRLPLLEEDGQSRAKRQAKLEQARQIEYQRQLAEQQALQRAMATRSAPIQPTSPAPNIVDRSTAELPAALRQQPYTSVPAPTAPHVAPKTQRQAMAQPQNASLPEDPNADAKVVASTEEPVKFESASPPVVRRSVERRRTGDDAFPELPSLSPVQPTETGRATGPARTGPYFTQEAPAELPPVKKAAPTPTKSQPPTLKPTVSKPAERTGQPRIVQPRIVGQAAPSAVRTTAAPTIRRAPSAAASGAPHSLSEPMRTPTPVPSVTRAEPVGDIIPDTVQNLQRTAAQRAVIRVNTYRAENGLGPLAYSEDLSLVARAQVMDLAARGQVSSKNSEGHTIGVRLHNSGYQSRVAGSLVAGGYPTFEQAFQNWTKNEIEASRLLLPSATEFGFAVVTEPGSTYRTYIEAVIAGQ